MPRLRLDYELGVDAYTAYDKDKLDSIAKGTLDEYAKIFPTANAGSVDILPQNIRTRIDVLRLFTAMEFRDLTDEDYNHIALTYVRHMLDTHFIIDAFEQAHHNHKEQFHA